MTESRATHLDDSRRVIACLIAGQVVCLAVGLGMLPRWFLSSSTSANMLGASLLVTVGLQFVLLTAGLWRLRVVTRQRQTAAEVVAQRVRDDLVRTQQAVMFGLAHLSESRDAMTGQHLQRMKRFTRELTVALREHPQYRNVVTPEFVKLIEVSAMLHDIGKVGIADNILLKPDKLTLGERREMEMHPLISSECLSRIEQRLGSSNFLQMAHEIALFHHERWDGLGYPFGLRGEAIPLSARIVAVADVYDALSSARVYKPAFPHEQCVEMIRQGAGTQFDPQLVNVFLRIEPRIRDISRCLSETEPAASSTAERSPVALRASSASTPSRDPASAELATNLGNLDELLRSLEVEPALQRELARDIVSAQ